MDVGSRRRVGSSGTARARWRRPQCLLVVFALSLTAGCAHSPSSVASRPLASVDTDRPLAGEALATRRVDLQRAHHDLTQVQVTLRDLAHRHDDRGRGLLDDFLMGYLDEHLDPLLEGRWQSEHPELMALDASLRLIRAEILIELGRAKGARHTLDDIADRYAGRAELLVEHPAGQQRTLREALERLGEDEWSSPASGGCDESPTLEACIRAAF
jgi:hypothetical protein